MKLTVKVISLLLAIAMATTMTFVGVTLASAAIVGDPPLSQIGNHTPPTFNTTSMTFTLDAVDADFGIAEGVFDPVSGYAVSVWGFNELFGGFYLFGDTTASIEEDFSLLDGSNAAGEIGTYRLVADVNANNPLDHVDPSKGYYFRIIDQHGEVTFIGAGGQQFISEVDVQSNTILFGSDTIGPESAWTNTFEDPMRGTKLFINTDDKTFQFTAPDGYDSGVIEAKYMRVRDTRRGQFIVIRHRGSEIILFALTVDGKKDSCIAFAIDRDTGQRYRLVDPPGIE